MIIEDYLDSKSRCVSGYIANMPNDIYHAHDGRISNSGLKHIARSPAHYQAYMHEDKKQTRNLVLGKALHCAVFEPDIFYQEFHLLRTAHDRACSEYKTAKKEFGEEFVLVAPEVDKIEGIIKSLANNKAASDLLKQGGHCELSGFSKDPETGVLCKHRFDKLLNDGRAVDLKSTIDARYYPFSKNILTYGYHQQQAFYADQHEWITLDKLQDFLFIAVESSAPYSCIVYRIDNESVDIGRRKYRESLNKYAECLSKNEWPGYDGDEIESIGIPEWAVNQELMDQMEFDDE